MPLIRTIAFILSAPFNPLINEFLHFVTLEVKVGYGNDDDESSEKEAEDGKKLPRTPRSPKESIYGSNGDTSKANPSAKPAAADKGLGTVKSGVYMTQFNTGQGPAKGTN